MPRNKEDAAALEVDASMNPPQPGTHERASVVFGWLAGAALGLIADFALLTVIGPGYPVGWTTFAWVALGCAAGMFVADLLGPRAFHLLGAAAGALVTLLLLGGFLLLT